MASICREALMNVAQEHVWAHDAIQVEGYDQNPIAADFQGSDIRIGVDLGLGSYRTTVWTCELAQDYIHINADYRS